MMTEEETKYLVAESLVNLVLGTLEEQGVYFERMNDNDIAVAVAAVAREIEYVR